MLHGSSFLSFCIGLNLWLVMIHGVDGQKAEKFYVGGSLALAIVLGLVCFASKQWTYNPELGMCWIHNPDPMKQVLWQIGIQHLWSLLTMAGEFVTFISVVRFMMRLKVFGSGRKHQDPDYPNLSASRHYPKPRGPKQYRNFVLRIALYPLLSLVTLGIITVGNGYLAAKGLRGRTDLKVFFATRTMYLARGAVYSLVAFMDPALSRGFSLLHRHYRLKRDRDAINNSFRLDSVTSEALRSVGNVEFELSRTSYGNQGATPSKSDFRESQSDVTLPSQPAPAAIITNVHQHLRFENPLRSHFLANDNLARLHSDEEYYNFERRL
ncbi:hypothetical protein V5O48_012247 [Marasmius crinis-equi]|uniref:G-protein coupled receptors family 2 profile 2 domain-containing protein n=1 Tax=Marasmius crinis-equi TaxID=585013 RepID=A0ABR3F3X4_9AGAR